MGLPFSKTVRYLKEESKDGPEEGEGEEEGNKGDKGDKGDNEGDEGGNEEDSEKDEEVSALSVMVTSGFLTDRRRFQARCPPICSFLVMVVAPSKRFSPFTRALAPYRVLTSRRAACSFFSLSNAS